MKLLSYIKPKILRVEYFEGKVSGQSWIFKLTSQSCLRSLFFTLWCRVPWLFQLWFSGPRCALQVTVNKASSASSKSQWYRFTGMQGPNAVEAWLLTPRFQWLQRWHMASVEPQSSHWGSVLLRTRVPLKLQNDVLSISHIKPGRVKDNDSNAWARKVMA